MTRLILFSGGIDSTYLAYDLLKNTKDDIHLHHVNFRNCIEHRSESELKAVPFIVTYLKTIRDFKYTDSAFDFRGFNRIGWDTDTAVYVGAKVSMNINGPVKVAIGTNKKDIEVTPKIRYEGGVLQTLFESVIVSTGSTKQPKTLEFPLEDMYKESMIKLMPKRLLDLTWSCRSPKQVGVACGKCGSCRERCLDY